MVQAAGSWSVDACCAVHGNECHDQGKSYAHCYDRASSSSWLFGLWPGPPQRFEPTGPQWGARHPGAATDYQLVQADYWPDWGYNGDLAIGETSGWGAPGGSDGSCNQGGTYRGTKGDICGGDSNWGATDVEVWYPR